MARITLRLPDDLYEKIVSSSLIKNNSINSEIINRLYLTLCSDNQNFLESESKEKIISRIIEDIQNNFFLLSNMIIDNK